MKIKIYFFGKRSDICDWEKMYLKRINFRAECEMIPLSPAGLKEPDETKKKEAQTISTKIKDDDFLIVLDERGKNLNSTDFSKLVSSQKLVKNRLVFVIGGAHGLAPEVIERANSLVALGTMVWTKDLARLMLLEQLYRAGEIENGTNFHKA